MKHLAIRLILYTAIALVPIGCGSRKVQTSITENKTSQDTKQSESVQTTEVNTNKSTEAKTSLETNTSEGASTTNVKKYDKDTGKLVEERTTVSNKKKSGTKQASETRYFEQTQYRLVNMNRIITSHVTETSYSKDKETSRNSTIWMVVTGLVSLFLGIWISPKVKSWLK